MKKILLLVVVLSMFVTLSPISMADENLNSLMEISVNENGNRVELTSNTRFIRYTTREEFDHYDYFEVDETTTVSTTQTITSETMEGLNGKVASTVKALGSGVEVEVGGTTETTQGYSVTISIERTTTDRVSYRQAVIHKNTYAIYETTDGTSPMSVGGSLNMLNESTNLFETSSTTTRFEVLVSSVFYKYLAKERY